MGSNEDSFVLYGQAFEDIEEGDGVSKKPLAVENQIVTDEKGRRRFHGAFTGGFSAGYFNTVGSVEGWTPSTFVSTRATRADTRSYRPEDFMDKEDLGEYGIAPRNIRTTKDFTEDDSKSSHSSEKDRKRRLVWEHTELAAEADKLADLIKPVNDSVGMLMLKKMGWRPGKGVGPLIYRKSKQFPETDTLMPTDFKFAPDDVDFHVFEPKADLHGLGYSGLDPSLLLQQSLSKESALKTNKKQKKGIQGQAFGVGAFEDDDDDIYATEDLTKYDFALSSLGSASSSFDKNKSADDDFEIGKITLTPRKFFPPPKIARDYVPSVPFAGKTSHDSKQRLTIDRASSSAPNSSSLNHNQRSFMLGESSSVWSLVSDKDRSRIEEIKVSSQQQHSKSSVEISRMSRFDRRTPPRNVKISRTSESPITKDVIFPNDPAKRIRYEEFVNYLKRGLCMPRPSDATEWEWESEQDEFRKLLPNDLMDAYTSAKMREKPLFEASTVQPFVLMMKSKFTHATLDDNDDDAEKQQTGEDQDKLKAVQLKMFGPMTREKHEWHPHKNLCKRFNLPNPYPDSRVTGVPYFQKDVKTNAMKLVGQTFHSTSIELAERQAKTRDTLVNINNEKVEPVISSFNESEKNIYSSEGNEKTGERFSDLKKASTTTFTEDDSSVIQPVNEVQRPSMDLFRTIFASSADESSSEDEPEYLPTEEPLPAFTDTTIAANNSTTSSIAMEENMANLNNNYYETPTVSSTVISDRVGFSSNTAENLNNSKETQLEYGPALPEVIVDEEIEYSPSKGSSKRKKQKHEKHSKEKKKKSKKHKKSSLKNKHKDNRRRRKRSRNTSSSSTSNDSLSS